MIEKIGLFLLIAISVAGGMTVYSLTSKVAPLGGFQAVDLTIATSSVRRGQFICGATTSVAVAEFSGRTWFRAVNVSGNLVTLGLITTSTDAVTSGQGITLVASSTNYWDTGESNVNWTGMIGCVANVTGSVVSYTQSR